MNNITKLQKASFASNQIDSLMGSFGCSFKENPQNDGLSAGLLRLAPNDQPGPVYLEDSLDALDKTDGYEYFATKSSGLTCATAIGGNDPIPGLYDAEQSISNQLKEAFKNLETIE